LKIGKPDFSRYFEMDEAIRHLQNGLLNRAELDEATQKQYSCVLQHCVIDFGDSLDPLLRDPDHPELPDHEHIDLAFLDGLRGAAEDSEDFLPQTIYVRKCMRKLFRLFAKDAAVMQMTGRTVDAAAPMDILIGSPAATETATDDLSSAADGISRKKARKRHGIGTAAPAATIPLPGVVDETTPAPSTHFPAGSAVQGTTAVDAVVAVRPAKTRTTLIGSLGVGKSVLFFLAALHRSRSKVTMYYRLMESSDEPVSAFVMFPCPHNKVNVLFTRSLSRGTLAQQDRPELTGLNYILRSVLGVSQSHYYAFVNGPRYNDTTNNLRLKYDYLCTPGGRPPFKGEEEAGSRLWILDGWTAEEAHAALVDRSSPEAVAGAYYLCGGNIRDMLDALTPEGATQVKSDLDEALKQPSNIKLVIPHSLRFPDVRGRLWTMFRSDECRVDNLMMAGQYVDSKYILDCLRGNLDL
jgi:hypothetical protein